MLIDPPNKLARKRLRPTNKQTKKVTSKPKDLVAILVVLLCIKKFYEVLF